MPQFSAGYGSMWNVYIVTPTGLVECYYVAFPRLCRGTWSGLDPTQEAELTKMCGLAQEIATRFEADGRFGATELEIKKAFNRSLV